jgi:FAD:protein FMN transferase
MARLVFDTMGTTVSLETPGRTAPHGIRDVFTRADQRFSLYRHDSEASALARGQALTAASEGFRAVYAIANDWRLATDGAFTAHRPDGVIDLSGIVKAWAMARAEDVLGAAGVTSWCLNVGGDVATRGSQADGSPWTIGLVDPFDRGRLLVAATIDPERGAVATSGSSERGDHIWRVGDPALPRFAQVTVAAADIVMADVLATAIIAGGPGRLNSFTEVWPIDVLTVFGDGEMLATPGMRAAIHAFSSATQ